MRHSSAFKVAAATCLSVAALAAGASNSAAQSESAACSQVVNRQGVSGTLSKCTWDDGRVRVVGTLRDTKLSDGATLLVVSIGAYSHQWVICGSDTPVDTDYQPPGAVGLRWSTVSTDRC